MITTYSDLNLQQSSRRREWTEEDIKQNEKITALTENLHGLSCPDCESKYCTKSGKAKGNWHGQGETTGKF